MSGRGFHYVFSRGEAAQLLAMDEAGVLAFVRGMGPAPAFAHGGYAGWETLHRCLSDGTLDPAGGTPPLNTCFLGGRLLCSTTAVVNLVMPEDVQAAAEAFRALPPGWFADRLRAVSGGTVPEAVLKEQADRFDALRRYYLWAGDGDVALVFYADAGLDAA